AAGEGLGVRARGGQSDDPPHHELSTQHSALPPDSALSTQHSALLPLRGMRRHIAARMPASLQEMPQLTLGADVWMDDATKRRRQLIAEGEPKGIRPSYTDLVIKAVGKALRDHLRLNAEWRDDGIVLHQGIHVGMAVALEDGLIVPVIRDAD